MSKKRTGNIMQCILSAQQFIEVAERLISDNCEIYYIRPFFVNAGLACELFLKSIKMYESGDGSFLEGHNLYKLFEVISDDAKQAIRENYDLIYADRPHKVVFDDFLSRYSKPFFDFRYTFETPAEGNAVALLFFAWSLKQYVQSFENDDQ